jgi:hypothetical protein
MDFDAAIAASLEEASNRSASENAQISGALIRSSMPGAIIIAITEFSQAGQWFFDALMRCPDLEFIRQPLLPSGDMVLVKPDEAFEAVVHHLQAADLDLRTRHVVSLKEHADHIVDVIKRAANDTPRRERGGSGCKVKSQTDVRISMTTLSREADAVLGGHAGDIMEFIVQQKFVRVPVPSSRYSELSVKALTA